MRVKNIIHEDFVQYKKPCMFIGVSQCDFKCDKEAGTNVCQNSSLAAAPTFDIDDKKIITQYLNNPITEAVCIAGLEPFFDFEELMNFICLFTSMSEDDIVIYTGYNPSEISQELKRLYWFGFKNNIIIKFGRFVPNDRPREDFVLGVTLSSSNQFASTLEDIAKQNNYWEEIE